MKPLSIFYLIPVLGLLAVSCTSTRPINDNNVYMMKTSALPVGENLTDETSYATFKHREETNNPVAGYYNPRTQSILDRDVRANNNSLFLMGGMYQGNYNAWWGMHRDGMYYGPGLGGFNNFYGNSFGMFNTYSWQHGYYTYPNGPSFPVFINNYYGSYWNNYNGFGYGNNFGGGAFCLNNGFNFNGLNPTAGFSNNFFTPTSANYVSGPRSTVGGVYSGTSRGGTAQLKSQGAPLNTYNGNTSRVTKYSPTADSKYARSGSTARTTQSRTTPTYSRSSNRQTNTTQARTYSGSRTTTVSSGSSRGTFSSGSSAGRSNSSGSSNSGSRGTSSSSSSGRSSGSSGSSSSGRSGGRGN